VPRPKPERKEGPHNEDPRPKGGKFRISGKDLANVYAKRGIKLNRGIKEGEFEVYYDLSGSDTGGNIDVFFMPPLERVPPASTSLQVLSMRDGYGISNAQSRFRRPHGSSDALRQFSDKKIGMHIALDALKVFHEGVPKPIHIASPADKVLQWGKASYFFRSLSGFVPYLRKESPPDVFQKLLTRIVFEDPNVGTIWSVNDPDLPGLDKAEADATEARKHFEAAKSEKDPEKAKEHLKQARALVPGRNLLRRAAAEYVESRPQGARPLGKKMAKAYYSTIPRQHGFKDLGHKTSLGLNIRDFPVLTYVPEEGSVDEAFKKAMKPMPLKIG